MFKIIWSDLAKYDYWQNIDYLEKEWSEKEVENFLNKVEIVLNQLQIGHVIYKPTN